MEFWATFFTERVKFLSERAALLLDFSGISRSYNSPGPKHFLSFSLFFKKMPDFYLSHWKDLYGNRNV